MVLMPSNWQKKCQAPLGDFHKETEEILSISPMLKLLADVMDSRE